MAEKSLIELLSDMEEIQFLMHCAIESVRQSWVMFLDFMYRLVYARIVR